MSDKYLYEPRYDSNGKVFYRGAELLGHTIINEDNRIYFSPERMYEIKKFYENKIKQRESNLVRSVEKSINVPKSWMNHVISGLIIDNLNGFNGSGGDKNFAKWLVNEFEDRGYDKEWLERGQDI